MNNDLISRSALKKVITKLPNANPSYIHSVDVLDREMVLDEIDNAPTVEETDNHENCVLTMFGECSYKETGCSDCKIIEKIGEALKNDRPTIEPKRKFIRIITTYYPDDLICYKEYKGKPYFSIEYQENGETFIGYGTYNPDVLSRYLRDYFSMRGEENG